MNVIELEHCTVDLETHHVVWFDGQKHTLTALEGEFLRCLRDAEGRPVSQSEALRRVWGYHPDVETRAVALCIGRLRKKIERQPTKPTVLKTVRGVGYCMVWTPPASEPDFLGRVGECSKIRVWLRGGGRRLCVFGPMGIGKSTLLRRAFSDIGSNIEAHWIDVHGANSADDVETRILQALGLEPRGQFTASVDALLAENAVLFVDGASNPEHLSDLVDLKTARIIASCWNGIPDWDQQRVDALGREDAIKLYRSLGGLEAPHFVEELGGNPLAIRVAASTQTSSAAFDEHTLGAGPLDAIITGVWRGLNTKGRALLSFASLCREPAPSSDFSVGLGAIDPREVTQELDTLAKQGVIHAYPNGTYRIVDGARAAVHANRGNDGVDVSFIAVQVARAQRFLAGMDAEGGGALLDALELHWGSLHAALERATPTDAVTIACAIGEYMWRTDVSRSPAPLWELYYKLDVGEERGTLAVALARALWQSSSIEASDALLATTAKESWVVHPPTLSAVRTASKLHSVAAWIWRLLGKQEQALGAGKHAFMLAKQVGDRVLQGVAGNQVASALQETGNDEAAIQWFTDAEMVLETTDDVRQLALCRHNWGLLHYERGELEVAVPLLEASIAVQDAEKRVLDASFARSNLAQIELSRGNIARAKTLLAKAEIQQRNQASSHGLCHTIRIQGRIQAEEGNYDGALVLFKRSEHMARQHALRWREAFVQMDIAWTLHAQGRHEEARQAYDVAAASMESIGSPVGQCIVGLWRACLEGDIDLFFLVRPQLEELQSPLAPLWTDKSIDFRNYLVRRTLDIGGDPPLWENVAPTKLRLIRTGD